MEGSRSGQCRCCQRCPRTSRCGYTLLLLSNLGQWLVILAALIFIGVHLRGEPRAQETKDDPLFTETEVLTDPKLKAGIRIQLVWRFGQRNVDNNSIIISKDGCYLLCLHGSLESKDDKASVNVYHHVDGRKRKLLMQGNMSTDLLNMLTLQRLLKGDQIYSEVIETPKATLKSLSLKIIYLQDIPLD